MFPAMPDVLPYVLVTLWAIIVFLIMHLLERATKEAKARSGQSQDFRSELKEKIKENGRLQKTVAALEKTVASLNDQIAYQLKAEQDLRAELALSKQLQSVGEDQTGDSAINASEGDQPRLQSGTLGMEKEVPSSESEATAIEVLVMQQAAQVIEKMKRQRNRNKKKPEEAEARSRQSQPPGEAIQTGVPTPHNSKSDAAVREQSQIKRSEKMSVIEEGLKKPHQPFFRKWSFSGEADLPLDDLSGVVAEGRQPLSGAKDAIIPTEIDKEINKMPTDIEPIVLSNYDLELRQLLSDAKFAQIIDQLDKQIKPILEESALSDGRLSQSRPFSTNLRSVLITRSGELDFDNPKCLDRHHLRKPKDEKERDWLKENVDPRVAKERLNILEEAARKLLGDAVGRQLVLLYELSEQINNQLHPKLDLDDMISNIKKGVYKFDGEDLGGVVQFLAEKLKKQPTE